MSKVKEVSVRGREGANESPLVCAGARPHASPSTLVPILPKKRISVEDLLVWAYCREKVHLAREPGFAGLRAGGPSAPRDSLLAVLGGGATGSMNLGFEAPRDAYVVARLVDTLRFDQRALVRQYAMTGTRPDWVPAPSIRVERGPAIYGKDGKKQRAVIGYCVSFHGDLPEHVEMMRERYSIWCAGLRSVRESLCDSVSLLNSFEVTGELPREKPWK